MQQKCLVRMQQECFNLIHKNLDYYNEICLQINQHEARTQVTNNSTHPYTVSVFAICPMASPVCP